MCCSRSHIQSKAFQTKREILPFALLWILGIHLKSVTNSLKWKRNIKTIFLLFFFPKPVSRHVLNKKWSITMPNNSHSKNDYKTGFIIIIITIKHISRWFFFFVCFFENFTLIIVINFLLLSFLSKRWKSSNIRPWNKISSSFKS